MENTAGLKVVPISSKHPSGNSWSPLQLLEAFVEEIRAGRIKPTVLSMHYMEENPNGSMTPHQWQAGCTRLEQIAMLAMAQHELISDWRGE